jgi:hypothetical protein
MRVQKPTELGVGAVFEFGHEKVRVIALDHEAGPGELLRGIDRRVRFTCPQLLCRADLALVSRTGNAALEVAIRDMLVATGGSLDGDTLAFSDPVDLVFAIERMHQHLVDHEDAWFERLGGIELRIRDHDLVVGSSALVLLAEPTIPALAAWRWMTRRDQTTIPMELLRGIATDIERASEISVRDELVSALDADGPGLGVWIVRGVDAYLLWVDRDTRVGEIVVRKGNEEHRVILERKPTGWECQVEPLTPGRAHFVRGYSLESGTTIHIGSSDKMLVVAIR